MFFNPLFISNASTGNTVEGTKKNKFTNSNYLFANIINVSKEKLSFSEPNIDLDENNKALFNSLKSTSFQLSKKPDANTNQFISDELALSAFLSQILEQINEANFNLKSIDEENSKIEATVLPEQINQIVESVVAGNKISIPISNYGKVAFVEIQKLDKNLLNGNSPKGIKLGSAKQTEIQLTDADINKVVSGISLALKEVFNFENIEMESNKTQAIVAKIKNEFSKLVPSKDETFQPQKNILTNLISGIEKELKLNSTESNELKKVIVSQFAKLINEKSTNTKGVTPTTDLVLLKEISEELALTKSEQELIGSFNLSVVSPIELKEKIEFLMSKSEKHAELKPILNKINNFIKDVPPQPKENVLAVKLPLQEIAKELKLTPNEIETVKNIASEKVSLLELSKELKAEAVKVNASPVLKAVSAKMDSFISKTAEVNTNVKTDKLPLQEIAKELKLTPNEVEAVKNIASEKVSLAELSKELKAEAVKVNAFPVIKTVTAKLESFITKTSEVNTIVKADKLPLQEIAKELKLTPIEVETVKNIASEKVSLLELSKELKAEAVKVNASPVLKAVSAKLESFISKTAEVNTIVKADKLPLQEIAKELKLTPIEAEAVKNIASEKVSLLELSKELKAEAVKVNASPVLKAVSAKMDSFITKTAEVNTIVKADKLPLQEIVKELKLTPNESKLIDELGVQKIDLSELKKSIKTELANQPNNKELKSLLSKVECIDLTSKTSVSSKQEINTNTDLAFSKNENIKSKMVDKVKTGLKNIFNSSDSEKKEIQSAKSNFVITLKSEKSPESLNIDKLTKAESKSPELLKKSIYSSKESIELTKVKIIPINEDVAKKLEQKSVDNDFRKASYKNITGEFKSNNAGDHSKSNYSESKNFTNSQSNLNDAKINNLETNKSDSIDKTFDKQVFNSSQEINNKAEVSKSKLAGETKSNDIKVNETLMPKTAFVEHQIRNSDLRVMPKTVVQKLDLKNIKEEISNLIQKGEKKSVEFQLNPENLGKMNIKLEVINKMVSASIKVDNETTQQAVQNSLEGLKTSLNQQGVQLSSLNVSLADSEEKNSRYFKQKKKNNNTMNLKVNGFDDKFAHKNLGYNNYDFIA